MYRQSDPAFINILAALRKGYLSDGELNKLNELYNSNWFQKEAIVITTHNRYASELNKQQLNNLPGTIRLVC